MRLEVKNNTLDRARRRKEAARMRGKESTAMSTEETRAETPPIEKPSHCLLCGQGGPALSYGHWICDHCRNVVQAEALSQRRKIVKEGGGPA